MSLKYAQHVVNQRSMNFLEMPFSLNLSLKQAWVGSRVEVPAAHRHANGGGFQAAVSILEIADADDRQHASRHHDVAAEIGVDIVKGGEVS